MSAAPGSHRRQEQRTETGTRLPRTTRVSPTSYIPGVTPPPAYGGGYAAPQPVTSTPYSPPGHADLPAFRVVPPDPRVRPDDLKMPDGQPMLGPDGFLIPPARDFSMVVNSASRVYSYRWDEAMRDNQVAARAMRRDAFIRGLLEERILPTINRRWQLEVDDDRDPCQKEVRDALTRVVQAVPDFTALKRALLDGTWYGRAGVQWTYARLPDVDCLWGLTKWDPVHGDSIQYTFGGVPAVLMDASTAGWYVTNGATNGPAGDVRSTDRGGMALVLQRPQWRERFAVYQHIREKADFFEGELAGSVQGLGLRGLVYWQYVVRTDALTWMLAYMQSVGQMDLLIFNYPWGNAEAQRTQANNANKVIGKAAIVCPRNPQGNWPAVEQVQLNSQGLKALHDLVADYFDRHIERLIVGQSMSAGGGGPGGLEGDGRADFAKSTKDEILLYDAGRIDECLTRDLITPLKKYNFPKANFPVRFKSILPNLEADKKVQNGKVLVDMNVPVKMDEVREAAGYSRPEDGDEIVQPPPPPAPPGMPGDPTVAAGLPPGAPPPDGTDPAALSPVPMFGASDVAPPALPPAAPPVTQPTPFNAPPMAYPGGGNTYVPGRQRERPMTWRESLGYSELTPPVPYGEYGCLMAPLTGDAAIRLLWLGGLVKAEDLAGDGRETDSHVTVRYGFHADVSAEDVAAEIPPGAVTLKVGGLGYFPGKGDSDPDVLYAKVTSDDLTRLHKLTASLPHTDTYKELKLHATVAYVKKGLGKRYVGSLAPVDVACAVDVLEYSTPDKVKTFIDLTLTLGPARQVQYAKDSHGHEHRESGPGGGQFTGSRSSGNTPPAKPEPKSSSGLAGTPHADSVLSRMPPAAYARLQSRVSKADALPDVAAVTDAWYAGEPNPPPADKRTPCIGFYDPASGVLTYSKAAGPNVDVRGVLAHEMGHALDVSDDRGEFDLSGHPEFLAAWRDEINRPGNPLSPYAKTDEVEGFAEFARLLYGSDTPQSEAAARFPRCYAYFRRMGLVGGEGQYSKDRVGHEHKESGPGGGQFVGHAGTANDHPGTPGRQWSEGSYFHGTNEPFDEFSDPTQSGISFTDNPVHARQFGDTIHEVKLDVRNPIDITGLGSGAEEGDEIVTAAQVGEALAEFGIRVEFRGRRKQGFTSYLLGTVMPQVIPQAKALGYDGILVKDFKEFEADETVVFDPSQIRTVRKETRDDYSAITPPTPYGEETTNSKGEKGRWVTIGAQAGGGGGGKSVDGKAATKTHRPGTAKKSGGVPVFIKDGKITKGPKGMVGHPPSNPRGGEQKRVPASGGKQPHPAVHDLKARAARGKVAGGDVISALRGVPQGDHAAVFDHFGADPFDGPDALAAKLNAGAGQGGSPAGPSPVQPPTSSPTTRPNSPAGAVSPEKQRLRDAPVVKTSNLGGGVNVTAIVDLDGGGKGVFKPTFGEQSGLRQGVPDGTMYRREAAASGVADALGFGDLIPPTTIREVGGAVGSLQEFVPGAKVAAKVRGNKQFDGDEDASRAAVLDYVLGHSDRHAGNWMLKGPGGGKLVLIDNGLSLPTEYVSWDYFNTEFWRNAVSSGYRVPPDAAGLLERWPEVERELRDSGIEDDAIRLTFDRLVSVSGNAGRLIADLPAFWTGGGRRPMGQVNL